MNPLLLLFRNKAYKRIILSTSEELLLLSCDDAKRSPDPYYLVAYSNTAWLTDDDNTSVFGAISYRTNELEHYLVLYHLSSHYIYCATTMLLPYPVFTLVPFSCLFGLEKVQLVAWCINCLFILCWTNFYMLSNQKLTSKWSSLCQNTGRLYWSLLDVSCYMW